MYQLKTSKTKYQYLLCLFDRLSKACNLNFLPFIKGSHLVIKFIRCVSVLFLIVLSVFIFQNCSDVGFSSAGSRSSNKLKGGEGYTGKLFSHFGECFGENSIQLKTLIEQDTDGAARIVREDCLDLPQPGRPAELADQRPRRGFPALGVEDDLAVAQLQGGAGRSPGPRRSAPGWSTHVRSV